MKPFEIHKTIHAWQWNGEESGLADGFFLCQPEVHYSVDRRLVYFCYADLPTRHWISAKWLTEKPAAAPFMGMVLRSTRDSIELFREALPFMAWKVKSEASATGDHTAKFLNRDDQEEVDAFLDYAHLEAWSKTKEGTFSLPPYLEYREVDGKYGRGYRPHYMERGEWLVQDGKEITVMSHDSFLSLTSAGEKA